MPTIKIPGSPYRFFFYSNESGEPAHVHVSRAGSAAKFWIGPVSLASNGGFAAHELVKIKKLIQENETIIRKAWNDHFAE